MSTVSPEPTGTAPSGTPPPVPAPIVPTLRKQRLRRLALLGGGTLCLLVVAVSIYFFVQQNRKPLDCTAENCKTVGTSTPTASGEITTVPTPTPALLAAMIDGSLVASGEESLHPLAVMIENHPDARPQSGLGEANLVYEAIAEGGITRFMAVFGNPSLPVKVGPVRSARTYFVDFADEIGAFYAHVGGNLDALNQISADSTFYNLDQFTVGAPVFQRDGSRGVALEHTMYSSTDKLWEYATATKHWPRTASFTPWTFKDDAATESRPASQKIDIRVSSAQYDVQWNYDPSSNSYSRSMAGQAHKDGATGKQISSKNIVVEIVTRTPTVTKINEHGWKYQTLGSGTAYIFQNGIATVGTWQHEEGSRTHYYDAEGKEISFVRGSSWVHLAHPDSKISY